MRFTVPHPIPYQGSKRRLAEAILSQLPKRRYERLIEPFAGSAAITLASAQRSLFDRFILGDALDPLVRLWQEIIADPSDIALEYEVLWLRERNRPIEAYYEIREEFNVERCPAKLLYLLARCVKNAVRFNPSGGFNQSPDKRRTGTQPMTMKRDLFAAHRLLKGRAEARCVDFQVLTAEATDRDIVYLDPPYQGTSDGRDQRYIKGVSRESVIESLEGLNRRGVQFILSYDGSLGGKAYGEPLPPALAHQLHLDVGRSSQATLNGGSEVTVESLYISHSLADSDKPTSVSLSDFSPQTLLFA